MLDPETLEEIRQAIREALAPEFAAIHASLDRLEQTMDRNHLATMAGLDQLSAPSRADFPAPRQSGVIVGADPSLMARLLAIERELASWRKAGS